MLPFLSALKSQESKEFLTPGVRCLRGSAKGCSEHACVMLTCAGMCRDQLKRSHSLRLQGQKALDELKSEFEAITKDLAAGDAAASLSATSALTHGEPQISPPVTTVRCCRSALSAAIMSPPLSHRHYFLLHQTPHHNLQICSSCRVQVTAETRYRPINKEFTPYLGVQQPPASGQHSEMLPSHVH